MENFEQKLEEGNIALRDHSLKELVSYARERADTISQEQPELAALLEKMADLTQEKQEKRRALENTPEIAEDLIEENQQQIVALSKELQERFPEEFARIEKMNSLFKRAN